jgi:hypothetical protein
MTDRTQHCAGCRERQAEIDRLRAKLAEARDTLANIESECSRWRHPLADRVLAVLRGRMAIIERTGND